MKLRSIAKNPFKYYGILENRARRVLHEHRVFNSHGKSILNETIFYEAFDGLGILCNPGAIFEHILDNQAYASFSHIWAIKSDSLMDELAEKYSKYQNVKFVKYRSRSYFEYLGRSQYLINNSTFPHEFSKRDGQTYVNTWHGVPIKKMGYDIPQGRADTRNVIRNFLAADYLISNSKFFTEEILRRAFMLDNIFPGNIVEVGQSRVSKLMLLAENRNGVESRLRNLGLESTGKKVVLYAPTWRGANAFNVTNDIERHISIVSEIQAQLGAGYLVLAKVHQLAMRGVSREQLPVTFLPAEFETTEMLSVTDHLITDFSSIFVDYLSLDRPIHFLIAEAADYAEERGLYIDVSELPGSLNTNSQEVSNSIQVSEANDNLSYKRSGWRMKYATFDSKNSIDLAVDGIFLKESSNLNLISFSSSKLKLLVHAGSLIPNGITTAVINLLANLDYNKFDVTVIYPYSSKSFQIRKSMEIDSRARLLPRVGSVSMQWFHRRAYWAYTKGGGVKTNRKYHSVIQPIFSREWKRCVGDAGFDVVIGFDGYQVFWGELLLQSDAGSKFLWAHNDLLLDAHRTIGGRKPHYKNLMSVFPMYERFDRIVSVTKELSEINSNKLKNYATKNKFTYVRNFVDGEKVQALGGGQIRSASRERGPHFVTVGRLSPEKNQARIIRAFRGITEEFPESTLTIVGDGPLKRDLEDLARDLKIEGNVEFTGLKNNPFPFVKNSDCFVFSSIYEGQGLAILESLVLKVPVISTRFNVVDGVLSATDGVIVEASDEALTDAMRDFCIKGLPVPTYDYVKYNEDVFAELSKLLSM